MCSLTASLHLLQRFFRIAIELKPAFVEDNQPVGSSHVAGAMGDNYDRARAPELFDGLQECVIPTLVKHLPGFVKNQDRRLPQQSPRDCQFLLKTLGQFADDPFGKPRLVSVRQLHNRVVDIGGLRGFDDFFIRRERHRQP